MKLNPNYDPGYALLHEGTIALAQIEANGIRVDREYLKKAIESTGTKLKVLRAALRDEEVGRLWHRKFGAEMNLDSRAQLSSILFSKRKHGGLGLPEPRRTDAGNFKTDSDTLEEVDHPFIQKYLEVQELEKARSTYLYGILNEVDEDGFLHPSFNLGTTVTYRSSSENPNFQNMPVRDPVMAELIRRGFIAREGHVLIENDFKGAEVSVAACYHKDPVMLEYIQDPSKDMHRDMAMLIFFLKKAEVEKAIRHSAKNQFVFPQFYGDWYLSCARMIWKEMVHRKMKGPGGISMIEHLRNNGITELGDVEKLEDGSYPKPRPGTFVAHIQKIEEHFWNKRFSVYSEWKKKWYEKYLRKGYFDTYTGFRIGGTMLKNQVINYPVQGSAFHCLLWSLIRLQKELRRRKMKTRIVGQIHDSIVADVHLSEVDEYLALVRQITEKDIMKEYKWLILPLVLECEICPIGKSWHAKQEVKITSDGYETKDGKCKGKASEILEFWRTQEKKAA